MCLFMNNYNQHQPAASLHYQQIKNNQSAACQQQLQFSVKCFHWVTSDTALRGMWRTLTAPHSNTQSVHLHERVQWNGANQKWRLVEEDTVTCGQRSFILNLFFLTATLIGQQFAEVTVFFFNLPLSFQLVKVLKVFEWYPCLYLIKSGPFTKGKAIYFKTMSVRDHLSRHSESFK